MELLFWLFGFAVIGSAFYLYSHLADLFSLRAEISDKQKVIQSLQERIAKDKLENQQILEKFNSSFLKGRQWLCDLIAKKVIDEDTRDEYLRWKKNPAYKASDIVRDIKREKRELVSKLLFVESQLKTYQEYFPFLKYMEEEILEEDIETDTVELDSDYDKTKDFLSKEEYKQLSTVERNQLALDRFFSRCNKRGVGLLYEMYLGHLFECQGYAVNYFGVEREFDDLGRDLICKKANETVIVQAKCWSKDKEIHENAVCQLFGTTTEYKRHHPLENVKAVLYMQCRLSERGKDFAKALNVKYVEDFVLMKGTFPLIKCNIDRMGNKIYHLPFDQQYRRTKVDKPGEFMAFTVAEAESKGFRRAFRNTKVANFRGPRRSSSTPHVQ